MINSPLLLKHFREVPCFLNVLKYVLMENNEIARNRIMISIEHEVEDFLKYIINATLMFKIQNSFYSCVK